jgi:serine/threonine protein kinase
MMIDYSGQQIGNYRLVRRLGTGGFASVYLGQHVRIATQQAAIKILHLFDVDTQEFQREAETTAALVHPNIVRLFDFDFHNRTPFLVMEYASNGSLRTRHPQGTQVPLSTVVQYVNVIADALQYAHDKHIIHRDIKPDNVLIGTFGELRLSDFGISVLSKTGRTSLHPSYGIGGTPYYMAPEMFSGKPEKTSDQYSLAIMAYEWLCGTRPFNEGNFIQLGYQHTHEPVPPLHEKLPNISPKVEAVIMKALAKAPTDRYPTVRAFVEALEAASQTPPIGTRLLTYQGHTDWVYAVSWSPDGTRLASGSGDNTVQVWEASTGRLLHTYRGHARTVNALSWSPDGTRLVSGSDDNTMQVWEASTGRLLLTYSGHASLVTALSWSPDGTRLASGSHDNTVQVWQAV